MSLKNNTNLNTNIQVSYEELFPRQEDINQALNNYKQKLYEKVKQQTTSLLNKYPNHLLTWQLLAAAEKELGRSHEALNIYKNLIQKLPLNWELHNNLGVILKSLSKYDEAINSYKQALAINPRYAKAYFNLGNIFRELNNHKEAEKYYIYAIAIQPNYPEAYNNLADTQTSLEKNYDAEKNYKKAIKLNPSYADAYSNLGLVFLKMRDFDNALVNLRIALKINPNISNFYFNLAAYYYEIGEFENALKHIKKAQSIKKNFILKNYEVSSLACEAEIRYSKFKTISSPITLNRPVEIELLSSLYSMKTKALTMTPDARFGNGICSVNFELFSENFPIVQKLKKDLIEICENTFVSKIFIYDSFFNIYKCGSGAAPHNHLLSHDRYFGLSNRKFSLVYYLDVGDQNCNQPGILKIHNPDLNILPVNGMVIMMGSDINHSSIYSGDKDRVMIGMNFYCV